MPTPNDAAYPRHQDENVSKGITGCGLRKSLIVHIRLHVVFGLDICSITIKTRTPRTSILHLHWAK